MASSRDKDAIEELLHALGKRGAFDDALGDELAEALEPEAAERPLSPALERALVDAGERGLLDGRVARGRQRMQGALGGFGAAVGRIRSAAGATTNEMAERAGIERSLWEAIEAQRERPEALGVGVLASVVEAVQLRVGELSDILHRTERLRLVPGDSASYRVEDDADAESAAAFQDLLSAVDDESEASEALSAEIVAIVDEVVSELRRRGRDDLLESSE